MSFHHSNWAAERNQANQKPIITLEFVFFVKIFFKNCNIFKKMIKHFLTEEHWLQLIMNTIPVLSVAAHPCCSVLVRGRSQPANLLYSSPRRLAARQVDALCVRSI